MDCCRIVTSLNMEMLQRVHPVIESVRRIGSTDPAALLYDASEVQFNLIFILYLFSYFQAFQEGDAKADDNIRAMEQEDQLGDAVRVLRIFF